MAITYVGGAENGQGSSGSPTTGVHGITINDGDLVCVYMHSNSTLSISHSGGEGTPFNVGLNANVTDQSCRQGFFWKIAGPSEPTSYTFSSGTAFVRTIIKVFSADNPVIVDLPAADGLNGSATTTLVMTAGNGRTVADNAVSMIMGGKDRRGATASYTTADNGYTGVLGNDAAQIAAMAHRIWTTGGVDSTITIGPLVTTADSVFSVHASFVEDVGSPAVTVDAAINHPNIVVNSSIGIETEVSGQVAIQNIVLDASLQKEHSALSQINAPLVQLNAVVSALRTVSADLLLSQIELDAVVGLTTIASGQINLSNVLMNAQTQTQREVFSAIEIPLISLAASAQVFREVNASLVTPALQLNALIGSERTAEGSVLLNNIELNAFTQIAGSVVAAITTNPITLNALLSTTRIVDGDMTVPIIDLSAVSGAVREAFADINLSNIELTAETQITIITSGGLVIDNVTLNAVSESNATVAGALTATLPQVLADSEVSHLASADIDFVLINLGSGIVFAVDRGLLHELCLDATIDRDFDLNSIIEDC